MATAQPAMSDRIGLSKVATWSQFVLLAAVAIVAILSLWFGIGTVPFFPFTTAEFIQMLTPLVMLSLFIERAVEVFLTVARGEGAAAIALDVKALQAQTADDPMIVSLRRAKEKEEVAYKAKTQRIAFLTTLLLGIMASALGIRAVGMFVDPAAFSALPLAHQRLFTVFDVIVTGALVGGGADGFHKLITVFTSWMDRAKAQTA